MLMWKDEYATGVDSIDEQHRRLLEIAGDAYDLLKNQMYTDKYDKIIEIIEELKNYTMYHFDSEEQYMESIGYKKILSHKVNHRDFIDKIENIDMGKVDENQDAYILQLLDFVVDWIDKHILQLDKEIGIQ